jgi:glycosyltransferase involved in cell wall biosynthesis
MKICLINNLFEPHQSGGAGMVVKRTAEGLRSAGHKVVIISAKPYFGSLKREDSENYKRYYISSLFFLWRKLPKPIRLIFHCLGFFNIFAAKKIIKIVKEEKIEAVFTHNMVGLGFLSVKVIKNSGIKHVHVLHDIQLLHPSGLLIHGRESILDSFPAKFYQIFTRFYFKQVDKVVSPSAWLLKEHQKKEFFLTSKNLVCFNPLDALKGRKSSDSQPEANKKEFTILFAGNMSREKGADILLEAFIKVRKIYPNIRLIMAGSEVEKNIVDMANKTVGVEYKGFSKADDVVEMMRASSLLVVPSVCYENSPTVIYEAAAAGLPFLASDIGGISELAGIMKGELFKPGDKEELERKIILNMHKPARGEVKNIMDINDYCKILVDFANEKNY